MRRAHGDVMAVHSKTLLMGGPRLAVMANVIGSNPVRDVAPMRSKSRPKGSQALTAGELRGLFTRLRESDACRHHDLAGPIALFIATGPPISELLGLPRADVDGPNAAFTVSGKVIRAAGRLMRIDETKSAAGRLGHSRISMTQNKYMTRGWVHTAVAELLDRTLKDG